MQFLTKRTVFVSTLVWNIIVLILIILAQFEFCDRGTMCWEVQDALDFLGAFIFFPFLVLLLSLITYRLPETVFDAWKIFTVFAFPVILILTYFISQTSSGGGIGVVGFHPGIVLLPALYGSYFLISLVIIFVAWRRSKREVNFSNNA